MLSQPCLPHNIPQGGVEGVWEGQLAVIARTNAVLFDSMVDLCNQHDTYKFGFAGVSVSGWPHISSRRVGGEGGTIDSLVK